MTHNQGASEEWFHRLQIFETDRPRSVLISIIINHLLFLLTIIELYENLPLHGTEVICRDRQVSRILGLLKTVAEGRHPGVNQRSRCSKAKCPSARRKRFRGIPYHHRL